MKIIKEIRPGVQIVELTDEEERESEERSEDSMIDTMLQSIREYKFARFIEDREREAEAKELLADVLNGWLYSNDMFWEQTD